MALVTSGFRVTYTITDEDLNETTRTYQLRASTYANVVAALATVSTVLASLTAGVISKYEITETFVENAFVASTNDMPVSEVVSVTTLIAGAGGKKANYTIPMPIDTIMSGNALDTADTLFNDFHDIFRAAGQVYISDGEDAGEPVKGVRVTQARRFG